jgi:hypothetical protein
MAREDDLRRWVEAGVIDAPTADRIVAFEAERTGEERARPERPGLAEVLVYLAAGIMAAGVAVLTATNWEHLATPARIAVPGAAAAAVLIAGYALRETGNNALLRAASLSWLLGGGLVAVTVVIAASELGWSEANVTLAGGLAAAVISVVLWALMRMHPQVVGIGAAAAFLSVGIASHAGDDWTPAMLGVGLAVSGLLVLGAAEIGILVPRSSARVIAGAGLAAGAFIAGMPPSPTIAEPVALVVVAVLLAAGVRFESLVYVGFGVLAAFLGLTSLLLRHVDDPTVAGLALVGVGLLLLVVIAGVRRSRAWERWGGWRAISEAAGAQSAGGDASRGA